MTAKNTRVRLIPLALRFCFRQVSFYAFGIATLLFTAFGLAGFARFGDEATWRRTDAVDGWLQAEFPLYTPCHVQVALLHKALKC